METLKEKTARGLFWGGLSNGLQQLLNLAFGIFLARMLSSGDYGLVGMLAIFSSIAGTIQESGFTAALINKQDATARDYNAVFWFSTLVGTSMYVALFFCAPIIADFFGHEELTQLSRFIFLGFLISSTGTAHTALLYKNMRIKQLATANVTALALSGCVGVAAALCDMAYWSLAFQSITYVFLTTALRWHYSSWRPTLSIDLRPLKGMYSFSVKLFFTNIVNQVNNNIFSAIIGKYYSPSAVGYYTQGNKWMNMGSSTINGMVSGIAQPVFAEVEHDCERLCRIFYSTMRFCSFLSFPALLGLALVAPELITITIGEKWLPAVPIMRILCIQGAIVPICNLYNSMAVSQGRSDIVFLTNLVFGLAQIGIAFAMFRFGILWMVTVYAAGYVVLLAVWQVVVKRLIGFPFVSAFRCIVPYTVCALASLGVAYLAALFAPNIYLSLVLKVIVASVLYLGAMKVFGSEVLNEGLAFLKRKIGKR